MSRLTKKNIEVLVKTKQIGVYDIMDMGIISLFRMSIEELDPIIGNFTEEEIDFFFNEKETYSEKKELLQRINKIYEKYAKY